MPLIYINDYCLPLFLANLQFPPNTTVLPTPCKSATPSLFQIYTKLSPSLLTLLPPKTPSQTVDSPALHLTGPGVMEDVYRRKSTKKSGKPQGSKNIIE